MKPSKSVRLVSALLSALLTQTAWAQDGVQTDLSGSIEVATDYRFRGYSRSREEPAARADVNVAVPIGVSTSVFAGGTGIITRGNRDFGSLQAQAYAGMQQEAGRIRLTLGGRGYLFPDAERKNYFELFGSGQTQLGPLSAQLGVAFAPEQRSYGGKRGIYVYSDLDAGIPGTPLTVAGHLGWEDNAQFRNKLDWSVGLSYIRSPYSVGLDYVDTNRFAPYTEDRRLKNGADATLVVRLAASF